MSGKQKNKSFLIQGMILAGAGIITRLIGIAYRIPVNNILGDEGQGFYGCAFSIYNIALLLTSYSLPLAVSKLVSARISKKEHKNAQRIFKGALIFALIAGTFAALIIYCFSDFIAGELMALPLSAYALRVLAPGLFIVAIMGVLRGYFQGLGTMVPTAISQILEQIVNAVVSVIGASYLVKIGKMAAESKVNPSLPFAWGAAGGTLGTISGALFGLIFLLILIKLFYPKMQRQILNDTNSQVESYKSIYKVLFLTIAPVVLSTAIYNISSTIDQGIFSSIVVAQGYTQKEAATYLGMFTGKYNTLINIPIAIANALGVSLIPSLTAAVINSTMKEVREKIGMVIRVVMLVAIPSFVAFLVIPNQILSLLYIGDINTSANLLRLGAITVVFYCLSTVTNSILQGLNKMSKPIVHGAISVAVHLVAIFIMLVIFKWGIYSLVLGSVVFSLCMCILNAKTIRKVTGYRQETKKTYVIPLCAAGIMGIVILVLWHCLAFVIPDKLVTVLTILIGGCIYGILLLKFGALSYREILAMPKGVMISKILLKIRLIQED